MVLILSWLVLATLVGIFADSRGRNGFGYFFLSVALSPLLGLAIVLIVPNKAEREAEDQRRREEHEKQVESIKALSRGSTNATPTISVADELNKLASLRDRGILTDAEFQAQKETLLEYSGHH